MSSVAGGWLRRRSLLSLRGVERPERLRGRERDVLRLRGYKAEEERGREGEGEKEGREGGWE